MRTILCTLVIAGTLAGAGVARADDAPAPERALQLNLGLASPVGELGATCTFGLNRDLSLEAGAGIGFSGVQLSVMPRAVVGSGRLRYTPGVGLSVSTNLTVQSAPGVHDTIAAPWLNVEPLAAEWRSGGLSLTIAAGVGFGLFNECVDNFTLLAAPGCSDVFGLPVPSVRVGIGPTF